MNERGGAEVRGRRRGQKERRKEIRDRKEEAEEKVKSMGRKKEFSPVVGLKDGTFILSNMI